MLVCMRFYTALTTAVCGAVCLFRSGGFRCRYPARSVFRKTGIIINRRNFRIIASLNYALFRCAVSCAFRLPLSVAFGLAEGGPGNGDSADSRGRKERAGYQIRYTQ